MKKTKKIILTALLVLVFASGAYGCKKKTQPKIPTPEPKEEVVVPEPAPEPTPLPEEPEQLTNKDKIKKELKTNGYLFTEINEKTSKIYLVDKKEPGEIDGGYLLVRIDKKDNKKVFLMENENELLENENGFYKIEYTKDKPALIYIFDKTNEPTNKKGNALTNWYVDNMKILKTENYNELDDIDIAVIAKKSDVEKPEIKVLSIKKGDNLFILKDYVKYLKDAYTSYILYFEPNYSEKIIEDKTVILNFSPKLFFGEQEENKNWGQVEELLAQGELLFLKYKIDIDEVVIKEKKYDNQTEEWKVVFRTYDDVPNISVYNGFFDELRPRSDNFYEVVVKKNSFILITRVLTNIESFKEATVKAIKANFKILAMKKYDDLKTIEIKIRCKDLVLGKTKIVTLFIKEGDNFIKYTEDIKRKISNGRVNIAAWFSNYYEEAQKRCFKNKEISLFYEVAKT